MAVIIGSARIDERGKATGGKAGDQTGKEVSTQNWYLHSKGWRVFRAKSATAAEKIAYDMQAACDNPHIGYDQNERNSLYKVASQVGFDCARVKTNCETDCSALVRVCCAYAGIRDIPADFRTINEASYLLKTGAFVEMKGAKYQDSSAYLKRGDILVTKTHGHTVVVLTNGPKADEDQPYKPGDRPLKKGCEGEDVKQVQLALLSLGYSLPKYGADGDFGSETEKAVKAWQKDNGMPVTGVLSKDDVIRLCGAGREVEITGAQVNVRAAPSLSGRDIGTVHKGDRLPYGGETKTDDRGVDWYLIEYDGGNGWVSSKYARIVG